MSFGYIPHPVFWKDMILRVLGWPSLIRRMQTRELMRAIKVQPNDLILDVGCGMGNLDFELVRRGAKVVGLDLEIHPLSKRAAKALKNLKFVEASAEKLPFAAKSFDKVILSSILQVVRDDQKLLRECHRVLKKDGVIVGTVPDDYKIIRRMTDWSKTKIKKAFGIIGRQYYTPRELRTISEKNGFELREIKYTPGQFGNWLFQAQLGIRILMGWPYFNWSDFWLYPLAWFDSIWPVSPKNDGEFLFVLKKK